MYKWKTSWCLKSLPGLEISRDRRILHIGSPTTASAYTRWNSRKTIALLLSLPGFHWQSIQTIGCLVSQKQAIFTIPLWTIPVPRGRSARLPFGSKMLLCCNQQCQPHLIAERTAPLYTCPPFPFRPQQVDLKRIWCEHLASLSEAFAEKNKGIVDFWVFTGLNESCAS